MTSISPKQNNRLFYKKKRSACSTDCIQKRFIFNNLNLSLKWHPLGEANPQLALRSSPQFANRFVTKHKETQAFTGFWRVLFLTIPKGFTAKITSFFGL